jgi:hypothetical protein
VVADREANYLFVTIDNLGPFKATEASDITDVIQRTLVIGKKVQLHQTPNNRTDGKLPILRTSQHN